MAKKTAKDKAKTPQHRSAITGRFSAGRIQERFSETNQRGGVVIVNAKTGKAYRDNYEAFLKQTRKEAACK
ncbi:DNA-dependent helicase II (plasmid) [Deinococcus proteolyticus MRP]|uniref:DNA-dependent helicase II n=1 Tax=Deinococcus proteolyticus (strain ATCC 35074 / DSM 20540 / JCM 6276 / NBRC 101906 / NCIMB 13154 / VKM Ac-1939 / CCM 2703 / MRP) TaxID=693977 RepID=F0RQ83_DEIPM|nr:MULTISPECIES: hypothetical protein [Deinococcus]ADY27442.1 DNA-dependent helicase II [Deinococcus proteolyticus MRP]MCY1703834.1 DNA-dependent helicase II [Deinococcus sp. SL84]